MDGVNSCFLEQLILDAVRNDAILDLAQTGVQDLVQEAEELPSSEHNAVRFNITAGKSRAHKSCMRIR